jgi:hypothetical protein
MYIHGPPCIRSVRKLRPKLSYRIGSRSENEKRIKEAQALKEKMEKENREMQVKTN